MDMWLQTAMIASMFILRLGVPIAITLAVGYWLRRLDAKWQAEALLEWERSRVQQKFTDAGLADRLNQPCWVIKGCDEETRTHCLAYDQPELPCWMAWRTPDGRLPAACYDCERLLLGPLGSNLNV